MRKKEIIDYPENLHNVFNKLDSNGIKPIIVGGFVRDSILHIKSKDIDIELYGVNSFEQLENILEEFGEVNSVGKSFGVCKLALANLEVDFTLPRIDNKISEGHCGFEVDIDKDLDFKTATSRRDFTINAIGYDVIYKKMLDPFNGQDDIQNKILKAVNIKTFKEDPLRVLRAVGFASRLNFTFDKNLFTLCKQMCDDDILNQLPKERILQEIKKILLKSTQPSIAFNLLKKLNGLKYLTPLNKLNNTDFKETLIALDKIVKYKTDNNKINILLMLAILCYKLDKYETGIFISNLTNENKIIKNILALKENEFKKSYDDSQLYLLATKVNIEYFLIFNKAVNNSVDSKDFKDLENRAKTLNIFNKKALPILQGRDIVAKGIKPSNRYSLILKDAYDAQINMKIKNHKEAILWLENYLIT